MGDEGMMKPFYFAMLVWLFWGFYIPVLAMARGAEGRPMPFKPYFAIGVAYFICAAIGGLIGMYMRGEPFVFTGPVTRWGFVAGTLGAAGALALTCAMVYGGAKMPHVITAFVFPGVLTVSAIVSVIQLRGHVTPSPWLWIGIVGMIVCSIIIAYNTPFAHKPSSPTPNAVS